MLLAPACVAVLSFAMIATQTVPTASQAEDRGNALGQDEATVVADEDVVFGGGADVILGDLQQSPTAWGNVGTKRGFSIGTQSCNIGTVNLNWIQNGTNHPVIAQNLLRYDANGRLEQIGLGWLKHSFCALQNPSTCASGCPGQGGCLSFLAPGCQDPYTSARNGSHSLLGPRFQVNAFTGQFSWPYFNQGVGGDQIFKRVQVEHDDLNPALNAGATYYTEGQYVARDDALAGNQFNNASCREAFISGSNPNYSILYTGATFRMTPAIMRWPVEFAGAQAVEAFVPGEGLFHMGGYVRDNGDGTWTYNYAVHNLCSDLSGYSFAVPVDAGVNVSNVGFHSPDYHSGEPYTNAPWTSAVGGGEIRWTADATFAQNPNANALRWATTYSFWFTADVGPEAGSVSLQLFKNPNITISSDLNVPSAAANLIGDMNCDGLISVSDIAPFVLALTDPAGYAAQFPKCDINNGDINGDLSVGVGDIGAFVALLTN